MSETVIFQWHHSVSHTSLKLCAEMKSVIVKASQCRKLAYIFILHSIKLLSQWINYLDLLLFKTVFFPHFSFDCSQKYWRNCKSHRREYFLNMVSMVPLIMFIAKFNNEYVSSWTNPNNRIMHDLSIEILLKHLRNRMHTIHVVWYPCFCAFLWYVNTFGFWCDVLTPHLRIKRIFPVLNFLKATHKLSNLIYGQKWAKNSVSFRTFVKIAEMLILWNKFQRMKL